MVRDATAKILRLSEDLPIVVEIVDALDRIEAIFDAVEQTAQRRQGSPSYRRSSAISSRNSSASKSGTFCDPSQREYRMSTAQPL